MKHPKIRTVSLPNDIQGILSIYIPYIENTAITFEVAVPSEVEWEQRVHTICSKYPYLVCESDNEIVGYAYASEQRQRHAYRWNAELSVYVKQDVMRQGVGSALCTALMEILKLQKYQNVYGGMTLPNSASEQLHKRLGFTLVGTYQNTGYKLGQWHHVAWYEKFIGSHETEPESPLSIQDISTENIAKILTASEKLIHLS